MNDERQSSYQLIRGRVFYGFVILIGIILVAFNDYFGKEDLGTFLFICAIYILLLIFLLARWLIKKVRGNIVLKKEQTRLELKHLQSQISPHFFFNMLNNLYGWTGKNPKKAQEIILDLSDMMRYSIYDGQKEQVTIQEESDYLKKYIALHQSRYSKSIDILFDESLKEPSTSITPLLLIILVENAFKHGVERLRSDAYVHIHLSSSKDQIDFSVENNFEFNSDKEAPGIGLNNLKRRLEIVYPKRHRLSLIYKEGIYRAHLSISPS